MINTLLEESKWNICAYNKKIVWKYKDIKK